LRLVRTHKLFLAIGYSLLVASIFFPIAADFGYLYTTCRPNAGPDPGPQRAVRVTFWSFMHVQESLARINGTWVVTHVQWLSFSQYWDWWGPGSGTILPSSILIPTFILQIIAVLLGLITLLKANTAKKILPSLLAALTLNSLYFAVNSFFQSEVSIGFWLSILSTTSIIAAVAYTILSTHAPATMSELRGG